MICSTGHEKSIKTFCLWICIINLFFFHRQSSLLRSMKRGTFTLICRAWMKSSHFRMKGKEADTETEVMSTARAWRCALQQLCQVLSWRCVLIWSPWGKSVSFKWQKPFATLIMLTKKKIRPLGFLNWSEYKKEQSVWKKTGNNLVMRSVHFPEEEGNLISWPVTGTCWAYDFLVTVEFSIN